MNSRPLAMRPSRPHTIKELVAQAESFNFNTNIPVRYWARTAETLYQEASFAISEGDFGKAYMLLYRHSVLVITTIPTHPQSKDPESQKVYRPLLKRVSRVIEELEDLKPKIENAYQEWERMAPAAKELNEPPSHPSSYAEYAARDPTLTGNARILDASENQDLAVDLAQKELIRRDIVRRATQQAGIPEDEIRTRRVGGQWDNWDHVRSGDDDDLRRQMEATRHTLDSARDGSRDDDGYGRSTAAISNYNYPSIYKSRPVEFQSQEASFSLPNRQPTLPPKEPLARFETPPSVPRKQPLDHYQPLLPSSTSVTETAQPALPPKEEIKVPEPPKKERLTFKPGAYLENGDPIRSLFLPRGLRKKFLDIAADNTRQGLEMCGMLCGTPINNALFVRCLLIPDQKCTSDTCETENEGSMFDYCMSEDLLLLGWIHTHPTQTCFMSSRDLHTQAGYQIMMPESVAIVCAPKFTPSHGIFRLTHPPGLDHILNCNHTDTFHQHSISNIYCEAEQPAGHVYESEKLDFYVHDLRTK